ncbi:acetolactate decarboxylase [Cryobacterium sp. TMT1-21]|uniref:Alpha-acetolactate decarboxylase n=1 Tax=Cryobacterium shii TaxID=1259235 RepID=A0AAQ2C881_9MICO|nr:MULTISPECIES: acetolactate decarboxylase [Cryobacterium]TFC51305.1 acetolactate decarboxylase [Cryobacterium shii]TFC83743.1 acetolactate decarboxylase [Cryobacterium sp. TmT2-59]TFD15356.1 acetolactate decarboxylase [Cryobacterium sp. TMT1-21]TFD20571.1 acetolactate decarboxylase [Cryobacterium sp. TMT4-10]TFD20748.1 acetolactate decarboxylase [Cryobacterium sp. TMT2-23]
MSKFTVSRHEIFQTSLMSALLDGVYEDEMTVRDLLGHGSFGIGTFNGLDGEMLIIGGTCYQLRADGGVSVADLGAHTPYAVVTNFVPHIESELPPGLSRAEVSTFIDRMTASQNYMYALRIEGDFEWIRMRTVVKQQKPYRPMVEATDEDAIIELHDVTGVVAGFRTPLYEQGIGVPGCHVHFINDERTAGGHVLDFKLRSGRAALCLGTDLRLQLPLTDAFRNADLSPDDLEWQLQKTEQHK